MIAHLYMCDNEDCWHCVYRVEPIDICPKCGSTMTYTDVLSLRGRESAGETLTPRESYALDDALLEWVL